MSSRPKHACGRAELHSPPASADTAASCRSATRRSLGRNAYHAASSADPGDAANTRLLPLLLVPLLLLLVLLLLLLLLLERWRLVLPLPPAWPRRVEGTGCARRTTTRGSAATCASAARVGSWERRWLACAARRLRSVTSTRAGGAASCGSSMTAAAAASSRPTLPEASASSPQWPPPSPPSPTQVPSSTALLVAGLALVCVVAWLASGATPLRCDDAAALPRPSRSAVCRLLATADMALRLACVSASASCRRCSARVGGAMRAAAAARAITGGIAAAAIAAGGDGGRIRCARGIVCGEMPSSATMRLSSSGSASCADGESTCSSVADDMPLGERGVEACAACAACAAEFDAGGGGSDVGGDGGGACARRRRGSCSGAGGGGAPRAPCGAAHCPRSRSGCSMATVAAAAAATAACMALPLSLAGAGA